MEPTLEFISKQLNRLLSEQRDIRNEIQLLRGEMSIVRSTLNRFDDNFVEVLDRLRNLEKVNHD